MATRILGPTGSKRRKRFLFLPIVLVACAALFYIGGAQAVHDLGAFQLDGNALTSPNSTPPANDDWDKVCHQVTITDDPNPPNAIPDQCASASNTTDATAVSWVAEPDRSASIFTGGGSKDPQNVDSWAWKNAGGLPDKDNLQHAFAARYDVAGQGGTTDCASGTTCDVLYFGSDRFDNSGDAQQGFWFLQNACELGSNSVGGGTGFACSDPTPNSDPSDDYHRNGDLLVLSDFSNGGSVSTINIYRWNTACKKTGQALGNGNTCGDANLEFLKGSSAANCSTPNLVGDDFCGLVNGSTTNLPWSFLDKSGTPNNGAITGEFFEAGVNLTPLGLAGECFATLESETRSSTSTTAVLKDFVIAPFAPCRAEISTAPSQASVNPGTALHDTATIVGNQKGKYPGVSDGDSHVVNFYLCGPDANITSCSSTSNSLGTGTLAADLLTDATSTADSPNVNTANNPLPPGHYCFLATWAGDSNYTDSLPRQGEAETGECFDVLQSSTTTVTEPRLAADGTPITASIGLNTHVVDHALVTGATGFGTPSGAVNFFICSPSVVTGTGSSAHCADNTGTALADNPRTVSAVAGSVPPQTEATSSPDVVANQLGVWCFRATYVPDTTFYTGSSDNNNDECFTVTTTSSATSAQNWLPNDHVVVSTASGASLTGSLNISLRTGTCAGTKVYQEPAPYDGSSTTVAAPITVNTTNGSVAATTFKVNTLNAGTYVWRIVFTPNSSFATGFTKCDEASTVSVDDGS